MATIALATPAIASCSGVAADRSGTPSARPSPTAVQPAPTPSATSQGVDTTSWTMTLLAPSDLPPGWTPVGGPPSVTVGRAPGGGCMPASELASTTGSASDEFSYELTAQGLEKGHLTDVVLAFASASNASAYMQVAGTAQYGACIASELPGQSGVVATGTPTVTVAPLPASILGVHFHISFPYTFQGAPKVAEDDVLYLVAGQLRARLDLDTCCTAFDPGLIQRLSTIIEQRMTTVV
jgi:hypothetical protein